MTRGELIFVVSRKLGLDDDAGTDERALLELWANKAVEKTLLKTHVYLKIGEMDLISGTAEYRLDSSILAIDDGRGSTPAGVGSYTLVPLNEMIDRQSANIVNATYRKLVAIEGDLLIVNPTPDTGEKLRFYYVPRPDEMTDDGHDPATEQYGGIPSEDHDALEYYMLWQGAEYDDKQAALKPQDYFQIWEKMCQEVRVRKWKKRGRGLLPARVGYPGAHRIPLRNDTYPGRG